MEEEDGIAGEGGVSGPFVESSGHPSDAVSAEVSRGGVLLATAFLGGKERTEAARFFCVAGLCDGGESVMSLNNPCCLNTFFLCTLYVCTCTARR